MSAGAVVALIAQAIKASGAIVRVEPQDFLAILSKSKSPMVVMKKGGIFSTYYQYMTGYKGFVFYAKTGESLMLPGDCEVVMARSIWVPT